MGWARLLFLGDVGQQMDLDVQQEELRRLDEQGRERRRAFERLDHELDSLRQDHQRLERAFAALVKLLLENKAVAQADVHRVVSSLETEGLPTRVEDRP